MRKQKLLIYLRQKGFEIKFDPLFITCTDINQAVIQIKRKKYVRIDYDKIKHLLATWGYDVSDFDEITKKRERSFKSKAEIKDRINGLEEKLLVDIETYKNLSQIDMLSSTGNQTQIVINNTKGEINALKWVLGE
jgi:hypothetical protein